VHRRFKIGTLGTTIHQIDRSQVNGVEFKKMQKITHNIHLPPSLVVLLKHRVLSSTDSDCWSETLLWLVIHTLYLVRGSRPVMSYLAAQDSWLGLKSMQVAWFWLAQGL